VRIEASMGLGVVRAAQKRPDEAAAFFQKIADEYRGRPEEVEAVSAWANIEIDRGRYDLAEPLFDRLAKSAPDRGPAVAELRLRIAERMIGQKLFAEAQRQLDAAEPAAEKTGAPRAALLQRVRSLQAQAAAGLNQFDKARQLYESMRRDFAGDAEAVGEADLGLADLRDRQGNEFDAVKAYGDIADRYGRTRTAGLALLAIAEIHKKAGRTDLEDASLRRLLSQVEPDRDLFVRARISLAELDRQRRNFHASLGEYLSIVEDYPENDLAIWARNGAAHVYYELGQDKDAEALAKEIVANFPAEHEAVVDANRFLQQLYTRK